MASITAMTAAKETAEAAPMAAMASESIGGRRHGQCNSHGYNRGRPQCDESRHNYLLLPCKSVEILGLRSPSVTIPARSALDDAIAKQPVGGPKCNADAEDWAICVISEKQEKIRRN
jgi:hypothetical protein